MTKLTFTTIPGWNETSDFGCPSKGLAGVCDNSVPFAKSYPIALEGEKLLGSYEEILKKTEQFAQDHSVQAAIVLFGNAGGENCFIAFKNHLIDEFNSLGIVDMPTITTLCQLCGAYVNLEYPLPSGQTVKFLDNNSMYLGNQVECELRKGRCYGMIACVDFLLVCEYGENSADPEIVLYKRR